MFDKNVYFETYFSRTFIFNDSIYIISVSDFSTCITSLSMRITIDLTDNTAVWRLLHRGSLYK